MSWSYKSGLVAVFVCIWVYTAAKDNRPSSSLKVTVLIVLRSLSKFDSFSKLFLPGATTLRANETY